METKFHQFKKTHFFCSLCYRSFNPDCDHNSSCDWFSCTTYGAVVPQKVKCQQLFTFVIDEVNTFIY